MPADKLTRYVSETRRYLESPAGKAGQSNCRAWGYSYQRSLCAAVMTATHLIVYERIEAVVKAIMATELVGA